MNNIDKIFSDGLQSHSTPAPAGLWERMEPGLPTSTSGLGWMRWAAIVVPVVVATGMWMNRTEELTPSVAAVQTISPVQTSPAVQAPVKKEAVATMAPRQTKIKKAKQVENTASTQPIQ